MMTFGAEVVLIYFEIQKEMNHMLLLLNVKGVAPQILTASICCLEKQCGQESHAAVCLKNAIKEHRTMMEILRSIEKWQQVIPLNICVYCATMSSFKKFSYFFLFNFKPHFTSRCPFPWLIRSLVREKQSKFKMNEKTVQ